MPSLMSLGNGCLSGIQTPNAAREQRVLYDNDHCSQLSIRSLLAKREGGFVEAPPCHIKERKLHVKTSAKRNQDLDKGDIIAGGDLHTWLIFIIDISLFRNRKCNPKEEENGGRRLP